MYILVRVVNISILLTVSRAHRIWAHESERSFFRKVINVFEVVLFLADWNIWPHSAPDKAWQGGARVM